MTRAEKYKEVFGFEVDKLMCPASRCANCPVHDTACTHTVSWWNSEYKENKE